MSKKVASITRVKDRIEFWMWLDSLPYHISERRRNYLWDKTEGMRVVLWLDNSDEDFYFFK